MHTWVYTSGKPTRLPKKHRSWRRRLVALSLLILATYVSVVSWLLPAHAIAGVTTTSAYPQTSTLVSLAWPGYGQAAVGAAGYGLLASHNTDTPLATASTIKVVTALAVLAKHPLAPTDSGPTIVMTEQDEELYNWYFANHGSVVPIRAGQKLTERQALDALLLRSANNMADTLARWAFGSHDNYRAFATGYIKQLGLTQTTIGTDASGLNSTSVSSASDLVLLGLAAMKNPTLAAIVGQKTAVIPEVGTINNTNNLLGVRNIVGIKTGNNQDDMGAYLFASNYKMNSGKTIQIIGAVMGAPSIDIAKQDALPLLVSTERGFVVRTLFHAGESVGSFQPAWAKTAVRARVAKDIQVVGWRGTPLHLDISLDTVTAPLSAGDQVGTITVGTGSQKKTVGKIVLDRPIEKPNLLWRLAHPFETKKIVEQNA